METTLSEINIESKPEHKVRIYQQEYHGVEIKIVELDHQNSLQAGVAYKMPEN